MKSMHKELRVEGWERVQLKRKCYGGAGGGNSKLVNLLVVAKFEKGFLG